MTLEQLERRRRHLIAELEKTKKLKAKYQAATPQYRVVASKALKHYEVSIPLMSLSIRDISDAIQAKRSRLPNGA